MLKPSDSVSRYGDSASVQAVTPVNAEQASKRTMRRIDAVAVSVAPRLTARAFGRPSQCDHLLGRRLSVHHSALSHEETWASDVDLHLRQARILVSLFALFLRGGARPDQRRRRPNSRSDRLTSTGTSSPMPSLQIQVTLVILRTARQRATKCSKASPSINVLPLPLKAPQVGNPPAIILVYYS